MVGLRRHGRQAARRPGALPATRRCPARPGSIRYEKDPQGAIIDTAPVDQTDPVAGQSVRLTIDRDLQWKAEQALADQVRKTGALSGTVVVMDTRTGDILALADGADLRPERPRRRHADQPGNRALSDVYEPGSTSKVMTASAALEEGVVTPPTPVTVPGRP